MAKVVAAVLTALFFAAPAPAQTQASNPVDGRRGSRTVGAVVVTTLSTVLAVYTADRMLDDWGDSDDLAAAAWVAASDTAGVDYTEVRGLSRDAYDAWERGNMWRNYFLGSAAALVASGYLLYRSLEPEGSASTGGFSGRVDDGWERWEPVVMVTAPAPGRCGRFAAGLKVRF